MLVVLLFSLLYFLFPVDHAIGKRVVHRMKVRVLVMEVTLYERFSIYLFLFSSL